jgi:stearoyl-CoA desaturase (Delta-9 desaturase)
LNSPSLNPAAEGAEGATCDDGGPPLPLRTRIANLCAIILPFGGLVAAMLLSWGWGFSWTALGLLLGMYILTGLGITVGYHRLFTHRAFETNHVVRAIFGILGSMAVQGPVLKWVADHRRHHQHSDKDGDPHSPNGHGDGILGMLRGLWHAHVGWVFRPEGPHLMRYVNDLSQSRLIRTISVLFPVWVLAGLAIPTVLGGLITMSWSGALMGFVWGGLVRIFLVHHITWSVNSVCHIWGTRPFRTGDHSRNNLLFGILALGEGWHNNHHAFPTSARHGLRWWQFDASYWVIRLLVAMKLAWQVKLPPATLISAKQPR